MAPEDEDEQEQKGRRGGGDSGEEGAGAGLWRVAAQVVGVLSGGVQL